MIKRQYRDTVSPKAWIDICDIAMLDLKKQMLDLKQVKPIMEKTKYQKSRMRLNSALQRYRIKREKMKEIIKEERGW